MAFPAAMLCAAEAVAPTQPALHAILSEADAGAIGPLLDFARAQKPAIRHRVAIVLANLGHHVEAVDLYRDDSATVSVADDIRIASWSLHAHDATSAQRRAWQAIERAATPQDRLYSLSVLVEAHRLDDSLDALLARFSAEPHPGEEMRRARLELLRERKRFREATELFQQEAAQRQAPERSRQLISLYRQAGADDALLAAYRASIAGEPGCVGCYAGLAEFFLLRDRRSEARQSWSEFFAGDHATKTVLAGAAAMAQMGFADLAIEGVEALLRNDAGNVAALFFLADLHISAGRVAESEQMLARLDQLLEPTAAARVGLAEMYVRMSRPQQAIATLQSLQRTGASDVAGQIRLAQLYSDNGQPGQALDVWFSLWEHLSNPAQRNTVESGLIALAIEQKRLDELSAQLRARLVESANASARRNAAALLVKIQLRTADQRGALETIDMYLDAPASVRDPQQRIAALKEKLTVYRFMNDRPGYEQSARKLMALDRDGRGDYLRGIILVRLQQPDEHRLPQLRGLLQELRIVEGDAAVNGEFEAGVLAEAEATDAAIDAYRHAIALDPDRSDNYLLLAALLAQNGRDEEAFAMLKNLARSAPNDELFVAAIDGIVNTAGGRKASQYPAVLQWASVAVLERLILKGEAPYLYALLSDIAVERPTINGRDVRRQLDVLENSLAADSQRRVSVLRELLTLTAPGERTEGDLSASDPQRHLIYGRRLIALGEELPPDVYIDLGHALLDLDDPGSAAHAFELAIDTSFEPADTLRRTAALFAKAGHEELALAQYRRARIRDSNDIDIAASIPLLLEQLGRYSQAHEEYTRTLAALTVQQPARGADGQGLTRDYRKYHSALLQGLLRTWPSAREAQQRTLGALQDLFERELQFSLDAAQPADRQALAQFSRLQLLAGLLRRVALAGKRVEVADQMDAQLLQRFPADDELRAALASERADYGNLQSAQALLATTSSDNDNDLVAARALAVLSNDSKQMLAIARTWAATGAYVQAAGWARGRLDDADARRFDEYLLQLTRQDTRLAERLLGDQDGALAGLLIRIEAVTNQQVVPGAELLQTLFDHAPRLAADAGLPSAAAPYFGLRLSPAELVEVLQRLAIQPAGDPGRLQTMTVLYRELLRRPLDAATGSRVEALMTAAIADEPVTQQSTPADVTVALMMFDMPPDNVPLAQRLARQWSRKIGLMYDYTEPFALLEQGDVAAAARTYLELIGKLHSQPPPADELFAYQYVLGSVQSLLFSEHRAVIEAQLDAMHVAQGPSFEVIVARGKVAEVLQRDSGAEWIETLKSAAQAHSRDPRFLLLLHQSYIRAGRHREAHETLSRLHALDPQDSLYRGALFADLLQTGNFAAALALNTASDVDMRTENFAADMGARSSGLGELATQLPRPTDAMQALLAAQGGQASEISPVSAGAEAPDSNDMFSRATARIASAAQQAGDASQLRNAVRMLWISTTLPRETGTNAIAGSNPQPLHRPVEALRLQWLEQKGGGMTATAAAVVDPALEQPESPAEQTPKLYGELAKQAFGVEEIEAVLRSLPQPSSNELSPLHDSLAQAYVHRGVGVAKLDELTSGLAAGVGNQNDLSLWLALMEVLERIPDAAALALMRRDSSHRHRRSEYQLLLLARGFARAGAMNDAAAAYRLLVAKSLGGNGDTFDGLFTASALVDEVSTRLEVPQRRDLLRSILRMVEPDESAATSDWESYWAFVLRVLPQSLPAADALAEWRGMLDAVPATWSNDNQLRAAAFYARVGHLDRAVPLLKAGMTKSATQRSGVGVGVEYDGGRSGRYSAMLGEAAIQPGWALALPGADDPRLGAIAWLETASRALIEMSRVATLDADAVVQALALAALRLQQFGVHDSAAAAFEGVDAILRANESLKQETIASVLLLIERGADPHLAALLARQIESGRTEPARLAEQVEKIAQSGNAELALAAARKAAQYSHAQSLIEALMTLTSHSPDSGETAHWRCVNEAERVAGEQLSTGVK